MRAPGGGASCLCVGRPGSRALPPPTARPSGRAAGAHYPLAVGAAGCGRGDPSPTSQRALLKAGFARCGGGTRAPGGGASCLGVGRPGSGAPPTPTARPVGGLPGPTTHWLWARGGAGVGTCHQPHSARSCKLALRAVGAARGRPGGAPPAWLWGVRGRALPQPRLPALWAGCRGPLPTGCGFRGGAGVGTRHQPHSARSCVLWGRHEGARGGRLLPRCGASGVGRSPDPDCPRSGQSAGAHYPLAVGVGGCGRGDPSPNPQHALLRAGFARCGGGTRAPGGGASSESFGRPGSGALPPPTARPLGGLPGPTTHWLWVRGVRAWGPVTNPKARALASWLCALWGRQEGARKGASYLGAGRPGSGALPTPTARPLGGLPGPTTHRLWVRGGAGVGTRHQPHGAHSCELALRAVGAARGRPGGAPPAWVWGVQGRALSHPRLPALWAGCRGPLPTGCGCGGGAGVGTRHRPHSARSCMLWGRHEGAWGGHLLPGCGASGVGRSATRDCPPSGRAAVAHYPLAVGAGGCGREDPSPTPQRALLQAGFARCGGGTRAPMGGASCLGVGRPGSGAYPPLTARTLGGLPGPTTHWLWVRGGGRVCRACVRVRALLGRVGRSGLPGASWCASTFLLAVPGSLLACSASSGLGLPCLWLLLGFSFLFPFSPPMHPRCVLLGVFSGPGLPWALASCPPPFFFPPPPLSAPLSPALRVFRPGVPLALASCCPPPFFFAWCCAVVPCRLFLFFSLLLALVSCCSPLILGSLALAGLAGVLCCCLLCLCVCCWASLSAVVSWWVLVAPVVVSRWRAVVCPWVRCCAVLLRAVLLCAVLFRFAPFGAAARCVVALGRCPLSWGPVPSGAVFSCVPPRCVCFAVACRRVVLLAVALCAVCALGCRVVCFLSSPPCALLLCGPLSLGALLPCAVPRGAVLPRGAVVSCPAALLGLFLAWVWLYLLVKLLQNFVKKLFFPPFFGFSKKNKLYTTQHTGVQQDHVRCCALRVTRRS